MTKKLTPAQVAAQRAALVKELGGGKTTQTGITSILLPNSTILEQQGVPKALAEKYGLQPLDVPASSLTGGTEAFSTGLEAAIYKLPTELQKAVETRLGLNSESLVNAGYKTISEQIGAIAPALQAAEGHIGNLNIQDIIDRSTVGTLTKELTTYANVLASGNDAALTGATMSAKYSAEANADSTLTDWGLDNKTLDDLVASMVAKGVTNQNEILQNIRATPMYQQAFKGLAEYNKQPGVIHMTEAEYRSYSQSIQGAAQQYGGVKLNQNQIGTLLLGNVSPAEFQQRAQDIGVG